MPEKDQNEGFLPGEEVSATEQTLDVDGRRYNVRVSVQAGLFAALTVTAEPGTKGDIKDLDKLDIKSVMRKAQKA